MPQEAALIPNHSGTDRAKDFSGQLSYHIFRLSSPTNYKKTKDMHTTVAEFSNYDLPGGGGRKKKKLKKESDIKF